MSVNAALAISLLLATPLPDPTAYRCTGTSTSETQFGGRTVTHTGPLPEEIYAIDTARSEVRRSLPGERKSEDLCKLAAPKCRVILTSRTVMIRGSKADWTGTEVLVYLDIDRVTGIGRYQLKMTFAGGYDDDVYDLRCKPA